MKILLITSIYPTEQHPDYGTFVRSIHDLYEKSGHQVTLVAFQRSGGKLDKVRAVLAFYRKIAEALKNQDDFDLIDLQYPYLAALPLSRRLPALRIPLIVSVHGSDVFADSRSKRLLARPTARILEQCARIIVPSDFFKQKLSKAYGLPEAKIRVSAPGGYDGKVFFPRAGSQGEAPERSHRIGFASRLVEGKGWRDLLQAFAGPAGGELQNYRLILAGSGADADKIREEARRLGIADQVELSGALTAKELAEFYRSLELFVFPSRFEESLGMVGIEALASGIPVIATATGGVTGYMKDGRNGLLVPPGDPEALKAALLSLAALSEPAYQKMCREARISVLPYERNEVMAGLDKILKEELS